MPVGLLFFGYLFMRLGCDQVIVKAAPITQFLVPALKFISFVVKQKLPVRNTLDVMHVERNINANVLKHIFGEKDTPAVRRDMEHIGKFPHLWLQPSVGSSSYLQPPAPYVCTDAEKRELLQLISETKTPTGYASSFQKHMGENKFAGLKSHDHHVLLEDLLPRAIRGSLHPGPRQAIIRLGHLFKRICTKVVKIDEMNDLLKFAAETLCLFELWFPPGFFDIMSHLPLHLVQELAICGPVHARWCYSVERYMGVLARYVRDKARPEASMAQGYAVDEALGFCTEYFDMYPHSTRRIWDPEEELRDSGELVEGAHHSVTLSHAELEELHDHVITHSVHTAELLQ